MFAPFKNRFPDVGMLTALHQLPAQIRLVPASMPAQRHYSYRFQVHDKAKEKFFNPMLRTRECYFMQVPLK